MSLRKFSMRTMYWERRTGGVFSIRPGGPGTPRNVDALGKAYIIDHASKAARRAWPAIHALLLNIGGDIVMWGRSCKIEIADPDAWYDNAGPIATIDLQNAAVATSGTYARGAHLIDARGGQSLTAAAATVVASDAVTANALATTLCLTKADDGLQLVESTPGAEALRVESGVLQRTSGFALLERPLLIQTPATTNWPPGYHLTADSSAQGRPFDETSLCGSVGGRLFRQACPHPGVLGQQIEILCGSLDGMEARTRETRINSDPSHVPLGLRADTNWYGTVWTRISKPVPLGDIPHHRRDQPGAWNLREARPARSLSATAPQVSHCRRPRTSTRC